MSILGIYGVFSPEASRADMLTRMVSAVPLSERVSLHHLRTPHADLEVVTHVGQTIAQLSFSQDGITALLIGCARHHLLEIDQLPRRIWELYTNNALHELQDFLGDFAAIIVDTPNRRLCIATDSVGVRPIFYFASPSHTLFGSAVWPLYQSGIVPARLDYDALSAWLCLGYPLNTGTLFADIHKAPPGTIVTASQDGITLATYAQWALDERTVPDDVLGEAIHAIITRTMRTLLRGTDSVGCFLSGGYDSRYVLASLWGLGVPTETYTVAYTPSEETTARRVAEALHVPQICFPCTQSIYDMYGTPFHISPHGFPIGKFVTILPVRQLNLQRTLFDGLFGDDIVRGYSIEDEVRRLSEQHQSFEAGNYLSELHRDPNVLFAPPIGRSIQDRVFSQIATYLSSSSGTLEKKSFLWMLHNRKANYISNNHLQYAEYCDTLHPFYSRELFDLRLTHRHALFTWDLYRKLFATYFPAIADIPRASYVASERTALSRFSPYLWGQTPKILAGMVRSHAQGIWRTSWLVPRLSSYLVGYRRCAYLLEHVVPIWLLMNQLEEHGLEIAWREF